MSDEDELRRLLTEAAPEPPRSATDPRPAAAVGRRGRRRVQAVAGVLAMSVIATGGVLFWPQGSGPTTTASVLAPETSPYDVEPCPAEQPPETQLANGRSREGSIDTKVLASMAAVRVCTWASDGRPSWPPPPKLEIREATDALVVGTRSLGEEIARVPDYPGDRCLDLKYLGPPTGLMLIGSDGEAQFTMVTGCSRVYVDGRAVLGGEVIEAYRRALNTQRNDFDYQRPWTGALECGSDGSGSPVEPGRERIVAAIVCTFDGGQTPAVEIEGQALERLRAAWSNTRELKDPDENRCDDADASGQAVYLATNRSDVVQLVPGDCGGALNFYGLGRGDTIRTLPLTLADLGIP